MKIYIKCTNKGRPCIDVIVKLKFNSAVKDKFVAKFIFTIVIRDMHVNHSRTAEQILFGCIRFDPIGKKNWTAIISSDFIKLLNVDGEILFEWYALRYYSGGSSVRRSVGST